MREKYKYAILLISLVFYTWFVGWYVIVLILLALVAMLSCHLSSKWSLYISITSLVMGFVMMKYFFHDKTIMLPIGYSTFAFSSISYLVDCYKNKRTDKNIDVFCYLFFFPKMLCGPIVRFYPFQKQLDSCSIPTTKALYRAFKISTYATFCKFCVADNLACFTASFSSGINTCFSSIIFAIQLYLDFYAYSNFAIAFAILFSIELPISFNAPYKTSTFRMFWHRWNITISEWLKDYIYIPMGGNRNANKFRVSLNILVTFLVSGLWHGATLPFIIWGAFHGLFVIIERFCINIILRTALSKILYQFAVLLFIVVLWQLFRLDNVEEIITFINCLFTKSKIDSTMMVYTIASIIILWIIDNEKIKGLIFSVKESKPYIIKEVSLMCMMLFLTLLLHSQPDVNFFYFKF